MKDPDWRLLASGLGFALAACQPAAQGVSPEEIAKLRAALAASEAAHRESKEEIGRLVDEITALEKGRRAQPTQSAEVEEPEPAARPAAAMCFKDYCPCDPPQQGMDSILCDQLEEGINVDTRMMIAGRGAREARRQMESGDY